MLQLRRGLLDVIGQSRNAWILPAAARDFSACAHYSERQLTTLHLPAHVDEAEVRMRRALHLEAPGSGRRSETGAETRGSRRFSQPGDIPLTRVGGRKDATSALALATVEEALHRERLGREQVEAALAQANATIVTLQTKLAHAEIAYAEAIAEQHRRSEVTLAERSSVLAALTHLQRSPADTASTYSGEHACSEDQEEPVQWWVPGWKGDFRR